MYLLRRRRRRFLGATLTFPWWVSAAPAGEVQSNHSPRIASLSWAGAEILSKLGRPPVGVSDKAGFARLARGFDHWLPDSCIELGLGVEPNMELLQQLDPDLIVVDRRALEYVTGLQSIAPVFALDIYRDSIGGAYARAKAETMRLGREIGRASNALVYVTAVEQRIEAVQRQLSRLKSDLPVLVCDLHLDGRTINVYGKGSMLDDVMSLLGIANVWQQSSPYGFETIGIEQLAIMPDFDLFYMRNEMRTAAALESLQKGEIWRHLRVVKSGRVRPLAQIFTNGALNTAEQFATELMTALIRRDGTNG